MLQELFKRLGVNIVSNKDCRIFSTGFSKGVKHC